MGTANPTGIPFWSGKNCRLVFFLGEKQVVVNVVDFEVKREGVKAQDPICGEDRDRMQFITTHFTFTVNAQQEKLELTNALIEEQKQLDAKTLPKQNAVGLLVYPNDGTRAAYEAREVTVDDWGLNVGGRAERNKKSLPLRARYFDKVGV